MMGVGVRDPDDRTGRRWQRAVEDTVIHVVDQLLSNCSVHQRAAGYLPRPLAVGLPGRL